MRANYFNSYFLNNNNTIGIPAYWVITANLHKTFEVQNNKYIRFAKFFLQLDNLVDKTYAASGNVVADSTPGRKQDALLCRLRPGVLCRCHIGTILGQLLVNL